MRGIIYRWLLGRPNYVTLSIVQQDMTMVSFNVIFIKAENEYIGNINRGMTLHAFCDSPWGYDEERTLTKTYSLFSATLDDFYFYNSSDDTDFLRPIISFRMSAIGTSVIISNSDIEYSISSARRSNSMSFTGISAGETITVDCEREIITSSTGLNRMANFNKWFFRLLPGNNYIHIVGFINLFTMKYKFARKVGG